VAVYRALPVTSTPVKGSARPAILTAVGVLSIVIGALGLLANLEAMLQAYVFTIVAARTASMAVAHPAPLPVNSSKVEYIAPNGLSSAQRQVVIAGLSQVREMTKARKDRLDALLADAGAKILNFPADSMTPDSIAANVTSSMSMPSATGDAPDDIFVLATGRLQISDATAVFFPEGNPSGIRSEGGSITDATGTHLAAVQISAIVDRIQSLTNNALNSTQISQLESELQASTQKIITPANSVAEAVGQVRSAQILSDLTVGITTDSDAVSIGPNGEVMPGIMPIAGFQQNKGPPIHLTHGTAGLMQAESFLSFGAAAFLLVSGIMTVKNSSASRRLLLLFVGVKLALFTLAAYLAYAVFKGLEGDSGTRISNIVLYGFGLAIGGLIYAVALGIVMNLQSVRDFYKAPVVGHVY
jgi:hypothetical protein